MPVYARYFGETKEIVNGKVIHDVAVNSEYDGKQLHIDKRENDKVSHYAINNLKKLWATPKSRMNLLERLNAMTRRSGAKRSRAKQSRTKRSRAKQSRTKHSRAKHTQTLAKQSRSKQSGSKRSRSKRRRL